MTDTVEILSKSQLFTLKGEVISSGSGPDRLPSVAQSWRYKQNQVVDQRYRIISLLGEGGMAAVYKAHHLQLLKDVALKTFRTGNLSQGALQRFQREAQAIGRLEHRNIVEVYDFGVDEENIPYYTMECLVGESLAERLKARGPLSVEETVPIFLQVCHGLSLAHSKGVIHRDLKPANIFLAKDAGTETVKIVDFGMAGLAQNSLEGQKLTGTGVIFGSPLYMSPEQSMGEATNRASDIYSAGCTLFETLTGQPPFHGESSFATMLMHQRKPAPELINPNEGEDFSRRLKALTAKMLAKKEEDRFDSFEQIADELELVINSKKLHKSPATRSTNYPRAKPQATSPGLKKMLLGIACLSVLAAGIAWCNFNRIAPKTDVPVATVDPANPAIPAIPAIRANAELYLQPFDPQKDKFLTFHFPSDKSLGMISWYSTKFGQEASPCKPNQEATGIVQMPVDTPLTLAAQREVSDHPYLLAGFGPDDLYGLDLDSALHWDDSILPYIERMKGLHHINIDHSAFSPRVFDTLNQLTNLDVIAMRDTHLPGTAIAQLKRLRQLTYLSFCDTDQATAVLKNLQGSRSIKELHIDGCHLQASDMQLLASMPNLQKLWIQDNPKLGDEELALLEHLKNLQLIHIERTAITPGAIDTLKKFASLKNFASDWNEEAKTRLRKELPQIVLLNPSKKDGLDSPDVTKARESLEDPDLGPLLK